MTARLPRRMRRIFHVPKGIAYAVENSRLGIWFAILLGFRWIDMDLHVTKDGVIVCGHWARISKDQFVIPDWFRAKYGDDPLISDVLWCDLKQLKTRRLGWRGHSRRFGYITAEQAMRTIARRSKRLGLAAELKVAINADRLDAARRRAGLPKSRLIVMTLSDHSRRPWLWLRPFKHLGYVTVILARGPIPRSWEPYITYVRGRWVRKEG